MKLPDTKYLIAAAILVLVVLIYVFYRRRQNERATNGKKSSKTSKKNRKAGKRRPKHSRAESLDNNDDADDDSSQNDADDDDSSQNDTAQELYNLVHERMSSGMQSDEFLDVVGDLGDNLTYIEIKQLYNDARNKGQDPSRTVRIDDYSAILNKRSDSE